MAKKTYTRDEAVALLRRQQGKKTVEDFAKELGVSSVLIYTIYRGIRDPGKRLGFRRVKQSIRYERIPAEEMNEANSAI